VATLLPAGAGQVARSLQQPQPMQPVQGGGQVSRIAGSESQDPEEMKLANAMAVLKQKVPNLPDVMHRLSLMAEKHPFQLKAYIGMLMAKKL
jgi:hypothetical protein